MTKVGVKIQDLEDMEEEMDGEDLMQDMER